VSPDPLPQYKAGEKCGVLGQAEMGVDWTIGVRNPFARDRILGKNAPPNGVAIATSGNYGRFVEMGDHRYSHIIDPRTGYPVEGMAGVTAVAPDATNTDAMSTGLFVLGTQASLNVLRSFPGGEAIFIPDRGPIEIQLTAGMAKLFVPLPEFAAAIKILPMPPNP